MYELKYYKYKEKYVKLKKYYDFKEGDDNDPDIIRYDDFEIIAHPEDDLPEDELFDGMEDEYINDILQPYKGAFEGFNDILSENLGIFRVFFGTVESAKGKIYDPIDFDETNYVKITQHPDKSKVLLIDNANDFDIFTDRYGALFPNGIFGIRWRKITNEYKGFYLVSSALGTREDDIPYKGSTVENWIPKEFNNVDDVVIFEKERVLNDYKKIDFPFKGKIIDPYAINEDEFATINEPTLNNKILIIEEVTDFDVFTNKYGILKQKNNKTFVDINWDELNKDYDGFYIPADNGFFNDRYEFAFYKDKKYISWLKINDFTSGVVYIID